MDLGVSDAQVRAVKGLSKRQAIENLLLTLSPSLDSEALATQRDAVFASFKERLIESYETATVQPIDGIEVIFSWLRERGVAIAPTTGFDRELLDRLLARVGWTGTLDAVVCDSAVARGRPTPDLIREAMHRTTTKDVARVVAVGGTTADLYAANHAEVGYPIGVLSGGHPLEVLRQAPHDVIIESVADLPEALRTRGADK